MIFFFFFFLLPVLQDFSQAIFRFSFISWFCSEHFQTRSFTLSVRMNKLNQMFCLQAGSSFLSLSEVFLQLW